MANEELTTYTIGVGYEDGDGAASSKGVIFNDEYDANFEVLSKAMAMLYYDGNDALDKASGAASCEIYLRTSETGAGVASRKGATVGQECRAQYTTGGQDYVFEIAVQEDGSNYPFIQFDSLDCVSRTAAEATAAIADYSAAAFIDALDIWTMEKFPRILASDIITQYSASEALLATDIPTDNAAADTVGTEYNVTQGTVVAGLTAGTGVVLTDKVVAASISKDVAMADDSPLNLLKDGTTRDFIEGVDIALGLNKYGAATSWAEETVTIPYAGKSTQEFVAAGSNVGIEAVLAGDVYATELAAENVTVVATVYSSAINNVKIGIEDDVTGLVTDTPTLAATTWREISYTAAVTAGTTDLTAVILAAGAGTIYVTDIAVYRGDSVYKHYPSPEAVAIHNTLDNRIYNYIPFGDLDSQIGANDYPGHAWLNGDAEEPCLWYGTGVSVRETTDFLFANASWDMELDAGEYFEHYVGGESAISTALQECLGEPGTFSCFILKNGANTEDLDLEIITNGTGGTTTSNSFTVNDYSSWAQIAVTLDSVPSDATYIRLRIMNNGAGQINVFVDGLMYTQTEYPITFTTLTPWNYEKEILTYAGSQPNAVTKMNTQGDMVIGVPIGVNKLLYGMTVFQGTANAGDDIYYPYTSEWSGAAWVDLDRNGALSITLGNGEDYESASISAAGGSGIPITSGSLIGAKVDGDVISRGSDAYLILHHLTWGV